MARRHGWRPPTPFFLSWQSLRSRRTCRVLTDCRILLLFLPPQLLSPFLPSHSLRHPHLSWWASLPPLLFPLPGWEQGLQGMCAGEKRTLTIPYSLAYGEAGMGPIPPKATLVFDVEMMSISGDGASAASEDL